MCDTKSMICDVNLRKLSRFWCSIYDRGSSTEFFHRVLILLQSLMLIKLYDLWSVHDKSICLDISCIMTLIDWKFLKKQALNTVIHHMSSLILVQELGATIHNSDQYTKIDIYLADLDGCTVIISWEIHIVNNLQAKILVSINVLVFKDIVMNLLWKIIIISSCADIEISLIITIKSNTQVQHTVLVKQQIIISS